MRKLFLPTCSLLVLLSSAPTRAQDVASSLTIRVTDPQGLAVSGATVSLSTRNNGLRLVARTDSSGLYLFENLAPGEYLVNAGAHGFAQAASQRVVLSQGDRSELGLLLELAAYREDVVVTASSTPQTVDEISKAVTGVNTSEIDERNEYSITESLRTVPGLRVQQRGGHGSMVSIRTRGLRNEDTAVLIDGVRLRDAAAPQGDASAFLSDLIVTDIDRIETVRGSGSSLYGSNAIGGVINIVTQEGGGRPRGSLSTEGGSLGFVRARGQLGGGMAADRLTYSLGTSYLNVSEGLDSDDTARNASVQARLRGRLSPTSTVSVRLYTADASVMLNESPQVVGEIAPSGVVKAAPLSGEETRRYEAGTPISDLNLNGANFIPSANDPDNRRESRLVSTLVAFEQRPKETVGYRLTYHGLMTDRSLVDGSEGVSAFEPWESTLSEYKSRIHTLNARADIQLGRFNLVTAGYEFESESFLNSSFTGATKDSGVDVTQTSNTFYVQDQVGLMGGALQVSGAFRTQFFSLEAPVFEPEDGSPYQGADFGSPGSAYTGDGSVAYFFRKSGTKLRAHVGNGYRAPSLYERFGSDYGFYGYSVYGDPQLKPEKSVAFDTGLDQVLASGSVRVSATYFYTRLQKIIVFDFSGAIDPATDPWDRFGGYLRVDGGSAQGIELSATAAASFGLRLGVAYTYTDAEPATGLPEDLPQAYAIPKHQFSLVATQQLTRGFYVNLDLALSDSYLAPVYDPVTYTSRAYRFEGIAKADLGASYMLRFGTIGLRFHAKVENLFDTEYYENGFRTLRRTGVGGLAFEF